MSECQCRRFWGLKRPCSFVPQLLDYEACNSYTFSVEVSNPVVDPRYLKKGPFKDQATVRVMVLNADEPPQFSQVRYHLDVSENCPPVCSVGRVHAVDPDTGQSSNIRWASSPVSPLLALFPYGRCPRESKALLDPLEKKEEKSAMLS